MRIHRDVLSAAAILSSAILLFLVPLYTVLQAPAMGAQASHAAQQSVPAVWPPAGNKLPLATFAGGCFWGLELAFQREPGVVDTAVGYTAGHVKNPTYEQVCSGSTGHAEAVQVTYDENQVSYKRLTDLFLSRIDPTTKNRQGGDVGTQYRSGIYWHNEAQRTVAEEALAGIKNCAVEVEPASTFWPAEEYHQQYLSKGGRFGSGQSAAKGCTDTIRCYG